MRWTCMFRGCPKRGQDPSIAAVIPCFLEVDQGSCPLFGHPRSRAGLLKRLGAQEWLQAAARVDGDEDVAGRLAEQLDGVAADGERRGDGGRYVVDVEL